MTISTETKPSRSENAAHRIVAGEAVIVEPRNGLVNVINEVGSRIWELCDGNHTVTQIADIISSEYEVSKQTALKDTVIFLDDMREKGLVILSA